VFQDRDGGIWLLATLFGQFPFLAKLFADSAYAGSIFHTALTKALPQTSEPKSSNAPIVPKVRAVTQAFDRRTYDRLVETVCRRLAKDWENLNRNALAFLKLASIRLMLRKLCNP